MTGYKSKRAAARDKLDDDDTQVYQTELTKLLMESYDRGVADALEETKKALAQRPWVGLTEKEIAEFGTWHDNREEEVGWVPPSEIVAYIDDKLKEKNNAA
jgi:hypothetical protein